MTQLSVEKKATFLRGRLAILGFRATTVECKQLLELCEAQGWKFTASGPTNDMLAAAKGHNPENIWKQMWEQA
jgi:hypothetical protein